MARFEDLGYCPYNKVNEVLWSDKDRHLNLIGLWNMIRTQTVCDGFESPYSMETHWVTDALTEDPIAEALMKAIIRANPRPYKVLFCEPRLADSKLGAQCTAQVATLLQEVSNQLVVATGSKYLAVVGCQDSTVTVHLFQIYNLEDLE